MKGGQNVHAGHTPPSDPPLRCYGCRVGLEPRHVAKSAGGRPFCRSCWVPDRLPDPIKVGLSALDADDLPTCARCGDPQISLVEDPIHGTDAEVCRECYAEHGDPTTRREVTTDLARRHRA